MASQQHLDPDFPCALTIDLPLPTARLASVALQALRVDQELSPLVRRTFFTIVPTIPQSPSDPTSNDSTSIHSSEHTVLRTEYKATTNRMLRVAVNGFMESLSVVLGVMEELDVDVLGLESDHKVRFRPEWQALRGCQSTR